MIALNLNSEIPIYTQLRNQIVEALARGEVAPGEPLPTVRQLAEDLGINPMTVNKAYGELKHQGYLETNLKKGTLVKQRVAPNPDFLPQIEPRLRLLIAETVLQGVSQADFMELAAQIYSDFSEVKR